MRAGEECLQRVRGLGCQQCRQQKLGCSIVGMWRKVEKKEVQRLEMASDNTPAPLVELLDGFMEQMVGLVGDVKRKDMGIGGRSREISGVDGEVD